MAHKPRKQIESLLKTLTQGLWEKNHIMALALLGSVAGESTFLLGPPGTAKSMVARRLKCAFDNARCFEYLMSRFSTPDEVFGPVSIARLKNDDVYERRTEGYLPDATVVFLDEIWKAGPAIQNALLTVINEKIYRNGTETLRVPTEALIAASNELPAEGEGLEAIWDRFLIRAVSNCISSEATFYKMLTDEAPEEPVVSKKYIIDAETLAEWRREAKEVVIPENILHTITAIRKALLAAGKVEGMTDADFYVSDRRWRKLAGLLKMSAYLNDRTEVDLSDLLLLNHAIWNRTECIPAVVEAVVSSLMAGVVSEAAAIEADLDKRMKENNDSEARKVPKSEVYKTYNYFYLNIIGRPEGLCYLYRSDYDLLSPKEDTPGVMWHDDNLDAWIVSRCDSAGPFAALPASRGGKNVKLRSVAGGVSIDGEKFPLEQRNGHTATFSAGAEDPEHRVGALRRLLDEREEQIVKANNLFVSSDDLRLVRSTKAIIAKNLRSLELRVKAG